MRIVIDAEGRELRHRFMRGLMRSAARLTYNQVQAAADGRPDDTTGPLMDSVITPLYGAFRALLAARQHRGTLDLDLPERKVLLDERGGFFRDVRLDPEAMKTVLALRSKFSGVKLTDPDKYIP